VDINTIWYLVDRIDNILEAMELGKMITMNERIQIKRILDVALDKWFDEDVTDI